MNPHEQLHALIQRYARAADDRDIELLASLFHPEAIIDGSRGVQTRDEWLEGMREPTGFPTSMHVLGPPLVDLEKHTLDTYGVVYQIGDRETEQADVTLGVRYLDEVVRQGEAWVIRRRVARILWMR